MKSKCCFIPDQDNTETSICGKDAEWRIENHPGGPDDYTESCTDHVGIMLTDAREHIIHKLV